jgi:hypothetical protein
VATPLFVRSCNGQKNGAVTLEWIIKDFIEYLEHHYGLECIREDIKKRSNYHVYFIQFSDPIHNGTAPSHFFGRLGLSCWWRYFCENHPHLRATTSSCNHMGAIYFPKSQVLSTNSYNSLHRVSAGRNSSLRINLVRLSSHRHHLCSSSHRKSASTDLHRWEK